MVFNKAAKRLLETVGMLDVVLHDWWMYQLLSAVGGAIRYDSQPAIKYPAFRQLDRIEPRLERSLRPHPHDA